MLLLKAPIRHYAWGRTNGMAGLVGADASGEPDAELWVGTHPAAPTTLVDGSPLASVIASDPAATLGPELVAKGHTSLPFLLKVLAIGQPLSLQAHPSAAQAQAGFAREEAQGLALDDPLRTYRDRGAKPEALVAIEETWALCGFRTADLAHQLVTSLNVAALDPLAERLRARSGDALHDSLSWVLRLEGEERSMVTAALAATVTADPNAPLDPTDPSSRANAIAWIARLQAAFPGDPSALAPLFIDVLRLGVGEAVHLPAGNLHAYMCGAGVEIMAASDNVLRGGLTSKHIDVDELLRILRFEPGIPPRPNSYRCRPGVTIFDAHEDAFALAVIDPRVAPVTLAASRPSLLLSTGGAVTVTNGGESATLVGSTAAYLPPGSAPVTISAGSEGGRLWWASTGDGFDNW